MSSALTGLFATSRYLGKASGRWFLEVFELNFEQFSVNLLDEFSGDKTTDKRYMWIPLEAVQRLSKGPNKPRRRSCAFVLRHMVPPSFPPGQSERRGHFACVFLSTSHS